MRSIISKSVKEDEKFSDLENRTGNEPGKPTQNATFKLAQYFVCPVL